MVISYWGGTTIEVMRHVSPTTIGAFEIFPHSLVPTLVIDPLNKEAGNKPTPPQIPSPPSWDSFCAQQIFPMHRPRWSSELPLYVQLPESQMSFAPVLGAGEPKEALLLQDRDRLRALRTRSSAAASASQAASTALSACVISFSSETRLILPGMHCGQKAPIRSTPCGDGGTIYPQLSQMSDSPTVASGRWRSHVQISPASPTLH